MICECTSKFAILFLEYDNLKSLKKSFFRLGIQLLQIESFRNEKQKKFFFRSFSYSQKTRQILKYFTKQFHLE